MLISKLFYLSLYFFGQQRLIVLFPDIIHNLDSVSYLFILGQVNALFSDIKPQSGLQQDYIVSLENPLAFLNPSVLIGKLLFILGIAVFDYMPSNVTCEFRVISIARSSLT